MQTTTLVASAPAGIQTTSVQVAAVLCGYELGQVTESSHICLHANLEDKWAGTTHASTAMGLTGVSRWLLQNSGMPVQNQAQQASWLEAAATTLLPIILRRQEQQSQQQQQQQDAPIFQAAVDDFVHHIEHYLFVNHQTWLVGDSASLADAMVAISVAACCQELPEQVFRWCNTTLHRLLDFDLFSSSIRREIQTLVSGLKVGKPSPLHLAPSTETTRANVATTIETTTTTTTETTKLAVAADTTTTDNAVLQALTAQGIPYKAYTHQACDTADELVSNVKLPDPSHTHTKNLFLRDKKHGLFLVTVRPHAVVNTKTLGQQLQLTGKTNLRLADAGMLWNELRVKPGCVGPLCVLQDGIHVKTTATDVDDKTAITVVLDQALLSNFKTIHSHPLRNDMSVQLTPDQLLEALKKIQVEPVLIEFEQSEENAGKAPANRPPATKTPPKSKPLAAKQQQHPDKKAAKKGETGLALQWKKQEHFANWYTDVIVLSEMISYYDISGCYILRPWSYKIWELIQEWFNAKIQDLDVENAYFPLFVSRDRLEREKDHVEGFAPEVAWVTKSGEGDLARPIAIRPTSETIMYPAYSDWIKSHRDLPLKLNQWSNVVRWEFKYPTPFLRTREFLWQEGHTAHATDQDAEEMVMAALELYRGVYEDLLAVPVVPGYKTEKEKFAGGLRTTTVEAYIAGSGRAIQGATSHHLGQNFGKMFEITFQNDQGKTETAWQTSWGLTTRTIGVMVMVHGDNKGLVLPPAVAPLQVVIVPIVGKNLTSEQAAPYCESILQDLKANHVRVKYDNRDMYNPGWKYNHWEQKGVPIRIEVGPRDMEKKSARIVIRHSGDKEDWPVQGLGTLIQSKLQEIQKTMFAKAKEARDSHIVKVTEWKDFVPNLEKNNLVLTPWCGGEHLEWEEWVKTTSREESLKARGEEGEDEKTATSVAAKTLCIPFDQPELPAGTKCIASGMDATCWVLWGRSY